MEAKHLEYQTKRTKTSRECGQQVLQAKVFSLLFPRQLAVTVAAMQPLDIMLQWSTLKYPELNYFTPTWKIISGNILHTIYHLLN